MWTFNARREWYVIVTLACVVNDPISATYRPIDCSERMVRCSP